MKIYVVFEQNHNEGLSMLRIFSSKEKANRFIGRKLKDKPSWVYKYLVEPWKLDGKALAGSYYK